MTDAEYEALKTKLLVWVTDWQNIFGLDHWKIECVWSREGFSDERAASGWSPVARVTAQWPYQTAQIEFAMPSLIGEGANPEGTVVHELCHVLLAEMANRHHKDGLDHEERVVSQLASAFIRLRDAKLAEAQATSPPA